MLQSLLYYRSNFCNHALFIRIKVAIVNMIYRKVSMKVKNDDRHDDGDDMMMMM